MQQIDKTQLVDKNTFCKHAVCKKDYAALNWALQNNYFAYIPELCVLAAANADFKMLKWLHQHGAPWNQQTCIAAIDAQQMGILQWTIKRGCLIKSSLYKYALNKKEYAMAKWILEYINSSAYTISIMRCQTRSLEET